MPMRLQLMSQRMTAVKSAAIRASPEPSTSRVNRNIATTPANPNATETSLAVVMDIPARSMTRAIGSRNRLGRLVDGTKTRVLPGSDSMCRAWLMLSASSNQSPAGNPCRPTSRTVRARMTTTASPTHGIASCIPTLTRARLRQALSSAVHLPSSPITEAEKTMTERP